MAGQISQNRLFLYTQPQLPIKIHLAAVKLTHTHNTHTMRRVGEGYLQKKEVFFYFIRGMSRE